MTGRKTRGIQDILIAAADGLVGFPEAIDAVFPKTEVQLCIVHMARNSTIVGVVEKSQRAMYLSEKKFMVR